MGEYAFADSMDLPAEPVSAQARDAEVTTNVRLDDIDMNDSEGPDVPQSTSPDVDSEDVTSHSGGTDMEERVQGESEVEFEGNHHLPIDGRSPSIGQMIFNIIN